MIEHVGSAITTTSTPEVARPPAPKPDSSHSSGAAKSAASGGKDLPAKPAAGEARTLDLAGRVEAAVARLNAYVQDIQRDLHFSVDDNTGRTIIKVVDSQSEEVIRQIPPEEVLALARYLESAGEGVLMREEV